METYTYETLPESIKSIAMEHVRKDSRLCLSQAICKVLTIQHRFQYVCFGGTAGMPIAEYRKISGTRARY